MTTQRARYARSAAYAVLGVVALALLLVARDLRTDIASQRSLALASRQSRVEFQARQTFLLCSRKPTLISVEIAPDVRRACAGYRSLAQARRTEAAHSPIPKPGG